MKFTCNVGALASEIALLLAVAGRKTTIPILNSILFVADVEGLTLSATDVDCSFRVRLPAEVQEPGGLALEAKRLAGILQSFDAKGTVSFVEEPKDRWVGLKCGAAKLRVPGLPAEDFPHIQDPPAGDAVPVEAKVLAELIRRSAFAGQMDDQNWSGMRLLVRGGNAEMSATDGHRASQVALKTATSGEIEVVCTRASFDLLGKLIESAVDVALLRRDFERIWATVGDRLLVTKVDSKRFPVLDKAMENSTKGTSDPVSLPVAAFAKAIKRAQIMAGEIEGARPVKFSLSDGKLEIRGSSDRGEAEDAFDVTFSGKDVDHKLSSSYILGFLSVVTGENVTVRLPLNDSYGALFVDGAVDHRYIVMGMR
jgi:DNA polymerase-3 subunit beta